MPSNPDSSHPSVKRKGVYFCDPSSIDRVYGSAELSAIAERFDMYEPLVTRENWRSHRDALAEAEVIVSSWGGAILDEELLAAMPALKVYFYSAGTIQELMTQAAWARGVRITNAVAANAIPVAEFCVAQILFSLKHGWKYMQLAKADNPQLWHADKPVPGNYKSKVGFISFGSIGRKTCELLQLFDLELFVSTGYPDASLSDQWGIIYTDMETIFKECDVVSIHLPSNEKTRNRINFELLSMMKPDATLINTARGAVIDQSDLIRFLQQRTDVTACIDVTEPEPPEADCPLFKLDNVVLTPHLAGSMGNETKRLAEYMIEEMDRWIAGEPLKWEITEQAAKSMA